MKFFLTILTFILFVNCIGQTQKTITGFIQDKTGAPLDAVTVIIKGTNLGTATDASGHFTFNQIAVNALVLECSKIGYETQLINVQLNTAQTTSLHIVLSERVTALRSVTVYSGKNVFNPVEQMADETEGRLLAGKKNGVINISNANSTPVPVANGSKGPVPGYGLWDMSVTVHFLNNYQLKGGINNIADKQYFTKRPTFYPDPGIWPSDGRSMYITVGCRF